jgi:hypothetical protein
MFDQLCTVGVLAVSYTVCPNDSCVACCTGRVQVLMLKCCQYIMAGWEDSAHVHVGPGINCRWLLRWSVWAWFSCGFAAVVLLAEALAAGACLHKWSIVG